MGDILSRYLPPREAADFLGVEPRAIRQLPDLPYARLGPRTVRYDVVDLAEYRRRLPLPTGADGLAMLIRKRISEHAQTGHIYFIQCRELVKIGFSMDPPRRRVGLQAVIPFELVLLGAVAGSVPAERELHAAFASIKSPLLTEWFYHSPALLDAIQIVAKQEATDG